MLAVSEVLWSVPTEKVPRVKNGSRTEFFRVEFLHPAHLVQDRDRRRPDSFLPPFRRHPEMFDVPGPVHLQDLIGLGRVDLDGGGVPDPLHQDGDDFFPPLAHPAKDFRTPDRDTRVSGPLGPG